MSLISRLYQGETSYEFVGRRRTWYTISAVLMLFLSAATAQDWIFRGLEQSEVCN